jgi:hypothetical protein
MLDVYQVEGIVKQAQAEIRNKFEKDHSDIVEFLAEKIVEEAKLGHTETKIDLTKFLNDEEFIYRVEDYLTYKGFYIRVESSNNKESIDLDDDGKVKKHIVLPIYDSLNIRWPKG